MVTSSAVVGSSAMITSGSLAIAIAIIARCRIPPENSCGNDFTRTCGLGIPTRSSSSTARADAADLLTSWWMRMASTIWSPTVYTGVSAESGSWKIIAIDSPRSADMDSSLRPRSSSPCRVIDPRMRAVRGCRPMIAREVTDFPEPDSPTIAIDSPAARSNESPRTACTGPASLGKVTWRSRTLRTVPDVVRRALAGRVVVLIGRCLRRPSPGPARLAVRHRPR